MKTAVLLLSFLLVLVNPGLAAPPPSTAEVEKLVIDLSNAARVKEGLPPLVASSSLSAAAVFHSQDMAKYGYFAHANPNSPARTVAARVRDAGSTSLACAENIFECSGSSSAQELAQVAVDSWLNSPGHRQNLLNPRYNRIGVGVAMTADGSYLFTQDFAVECIEVTSFGVSRLADGGYRVTIKGVVLNGPREGALLFNGQRVSEQNWEADAAGNFEVVGVIPTLGEVQIGQIVAPRRFAINTVVHVAVLNQ